MVPGIILLFNMGGFEVILIVFVFLMFFGAKSIPGIARSLGRASREFKDASQDIRREIQSGVNDAREQMNAQNSPIKELEGPVQEFKEGLDITKDIENG